MGDFSRGPSALASYAAIVAWTVGAAACGSSEDRIVCGAGTVLSGHTCIVHAAAAPEAAASPDSGAPDCAEPSDGPMPDAPAASGPTFAGVGAVAPASGSSLFVTWSAA